MTAPENHIFRDSVSGSDLFESQVRLRARMAKASSEVMIDQSDHEVVEAVDSSMSAVLNGLGIKEHIVLGEQQCAHITRCACALDFNLFEVKKDFVQSKIKNVCEPDFIDFSVTMSNKGMMRL